MLLSVDMDLRSESCHHIKSESCGDEGHAWRGWGAGGDRGCDVGSGKHGWKNDSLDEISLRKYIKVIEESQSCGKP